MGLFLNKASKWTAINTDNCNWQGKLKISRLLSRLDTDGLSKDPALQLSRNF